MCVKTAAKEFPLIETSPLESVCVVWGHFITLNCNLTKLMKGTKVLTGTLGAGRD